MVCERKKRLARIGIRRPNSQLGPALRLTTGRDNFYIHTRIYIRIYIQIWIRIWVRIHIRIQIRGCSPLL